MAPGPSATVKVASGRISLFVLLQSSFAGPALADQHRSSITPQERRTARDLLNNRTDELSGREQRLLREIRSGSNETLTSDERALLDRIQRKLPDVEGSGGDD
jgi:hypothetical protein